MRYGELSDAQLMASAQAGISPAFAVLLHRHGPAVRSAVHGQPAPIAATRDVFLTAIEELPRMDPEFPVRTWLLDIAGTDQVPDPIVPLDEHELDAIWASLLTAWPGHRRPPRTALHRSALVGGLVALSALVPTLVFLADEAPEPPAEELSAHPVDDEDDPGNEAVDGDEPLPTFSFPSVAEQQPRTTPDPPPASPQSESPAPPAPEPAPTVTVTDGPAPGDAPDPDAPAGPDPGSEADPDAGSDPEPDPGSEPDPEPDPTETSEPPIVPPLDPEPNDDANAAGAS